jgi:hypothetical protein
VDKYYASSEKARSNLDELLDACKNGAKSNLSANLELHEFARKNAGFPLIFGICLQKQHLDPSHFPRQLSIKNGYRPFLYRFIYIYICIIEKHQYKYISYSLIGSWGPLLFPKFWLAFREWWSWRSSFAKLNGLFEPITEKIVVNHFYKQNMKIWTPWIVRLYQSEKI